MGLLAKSTRGLGKLRVNGLNLVPNPPTRIKAFIVISLLISCEIIKLETGQDKPRGCNLIYEQIDSTKSYPIYDNASKASSKTKKTKKNNVSKEKRTETLSKQLASKLIMNRRVCYWAWHKSIYVSPHEYQILARYEKQRQNPANRPQVFNENDKRGMNYDAGFSINDVFIN